MKRAGAESGLPADDPTSDHELVRRVAGADHAAFAELVRRHHHAVTALAYRFLGRWDAAEDVGQEAFLRIWTTAAKYKPEAEFRTWLYRVVANLCWDSRRRSARRPETLADDVAGTQPHTAACERTERSERVRAAVAELPDRQRLALILHRYEGLSHQDIAAITDWSVGAVESCLVRAYEHLRRSLADLKE
jgi:RNA polymerase sigma-70 factor (ECF subfamily)